jgi:hypothetical protein
MQCKLKIVGFGVVAVVALSAFAVMSTAGVTPHQG